MRSEKYAATRGDERKKRALLWVIIVLQIIIILLLLVRCESGEEEISSFSGTAVIEDAQIEADIWEEEGRMRICCNTTINIRDKVMQDLNFINYNTGKLMRLEIVSGEDTIYSSDYIEYGKMLKGDYIDTSVLSKGVNNAIIRAFLYDLDKNTMGESNVEVRLII